MTSASTRWRRSASTRRGSSAPGPTPWTERDGGRPHPARHRRAGLVRAAGLELIECQLHELLLNRAFDDGPAWRLICPYDEARLPRSVSTRGLEAHPICSTSSARGPSERYTPDGDSSPSPPPWRGRARASSAGVFGARDIPATRHTVAQYARTCGLSDDRVEALELAASELATNSVRYGGGSGTVAMWVQDGAAVVEFTDAGHVADPLTGRLTPSHEQEGGRGLFLVHQLCDLVQLRSSPEGTTVRVVTWL